MKAKMRKKLNKERWYYFFTEIKACNFECSYIFGVKFTLK